MKTVFMSGKKLRIDGAKLRRARGKRSTAEVAKAIDTSVQAVSNWENGHSSISGIHLAAIVMLYGCCIQEIVSVGDDP